MMKHSDLLGILSRVTWMKISEMDNAEKKFIQGILNYLSENYTIFPIYVEGDGVIGIGVEGEEVYREIPAEEGWEYRYLNSLTKSPGFLSRLSKEIGDEKF